MTVRAMPNCSRQKANAFLSWANATEDKGYREWLRARAADAIERAKEAGEAVADLNPVLSGFQKRPTAVRKGR